MRGWLCIPCWSRVKERMSEGAVERIPGVVITERENVAPSSGRFRSKRGEITASTKRGCEPLLCWLKELTSQILVILGL